MLISVSYTNKTFPLNTSKDISFWCFQGVYKACSSLQCTKNNINIKNNFLKYLKWNLDLTGIVYIACKDNFFWLLFLIPFLKAFWLENFFNSTGTTSQIFQTRKEILSLPWKTDFSFSTAKLELLLKLKLVSHPQNNLLKTVDILQYTLKISVANICRFLVYQNRFALL